MAVIALIAADNRQQREDANQIVQLVEGIEPTSPREEIERLRAETVYHTSFGDLDKAVIAATRLVQTERALATSGSLLQSLRWQSKPLKLTNNVLGAMAAIEESFQLAARLELRHEMWNAALYAVDVSIDTEDLTMAVKWARIAEDIGRGLSASSSMGSNSTYLNARIAEMRGDLDDARALLATARATDRSILRTRGEEPLLAFDIHLRMATQNAVPRNLTDRLRKLHLKTAGCGVRDFETGVLVTALARGGDVEDARSLYDRYVTGRRSRLRFHSALMRASQSLVLPPTYDAFAALAESSLAVV
jgi:hypothetical protein